MSIIARRLIDDFFNWGFQEHYALEPQNTWETYSVKGFPHYNIARVNERNYNIEVALAGYSVDDIKVELENDVLTITGKNKEVSNKYAYKGITTQAFSRDFCLHPGADIGTISFENGILTIPVHVPEIENTRKTLQIKQIKTE
jgi:molecular chaperone IbpA